MTDGCKAKACCCPPPEETTWRNLVRLSIRYELIRFFGALPH